MVCANKRLDKANKKHAGAGRSSSCKTKQTLRSPIPQPLTKGAHTDPDHHQKMYKTMQHISKIQMQKKQQIRTKLQKIDKHFICKRFCFLALFWSCFVFLGGNLDQYPAWSAFRVLVCCRVWLWLAVHSQGLRAKTRSLKTNNLQNALSKFCWDAKALSLA